MSACPACQHIPCRCFTKDEQARRIWSRCRERGACQHPVCVCDEDPPGPLSGHNPPEGLSIAVKAICWAAAILVIGMPVAAGIIWAVGETVEHFTP